MSQRHLRQKKRISYHELDDPSFDEYVYCDKCYDYVYEYCFIHGPLLVIPDNEVPAMSNMSSDVSRPELSIPHVFLHLAPSIIPGAGLGVFATLTLPQGVRFGPYRGRRTKEVNSAYCWQIYDANNKPSHVIDGIDIAHSNWMRYVNCARHSREQNLIAYQYQGSIYYRTITIIPRCTELLVFYGSQYAGALNVDLRKYNSKNHYLEAIGYDPSSINKMKKIRTETESPQKIYCENVITTTLEISAAESTHYKNATPGEDEIEDVFQYLDDNSVITEDSQRTEEKQLKVEFNAQTNCFDIEFYNNDRNEFRDNAKMENQVQNGQQSINKQNLEMQEHEITNDKEIHTDFNSINYSLIADNNQVHIEAFNSGNEPVDNFNQTEIHFNNTTKRHNEDNFTKVTTGNRPEDNFKHNTSINITENTNRHNEINFTKLTNPRETWQCNICNKILTSKFSLRNHAKTHEKKTFNCPDCNYNTSFSYRFRRHMLKHTGALFQCETCPFSTNSRTNLLKHCGRRHGNDDSNCEHCSYKVASKLTMQNHRNLHFKVNVRKCDFCDYISDKSRCLRQHLKAIHKKLVVTKKVE